jgi:hypothetical protein
VCPPAFGLLKFETKLYLLANIRDIRQYCRPIHELDVKKFLIGCGALSLILLVIGVIGFAILAYRGTQLDKESSVYADAALKAIATDWSEKALLDRASPEFKQATPIDELDAYFQQYAKLGHLQSAEPMKGQAGISFQQGLGKRIEGHYATKAQFDNAEATITLGLIKRGDQWQILSINVDSPGYHPQ